jgi:hypothetical protein
MLKRYRTNLASVVWFAQKNFQFIGSYNKNNFYKNYPEQIIYIITDGLDEELKCINEWRKIIGEHDIKYGFIINQPNKIEEMIKERDINRNHFKWNNDDNISMSSNYDIIKEDDTSTLYDDNFSILSDYSSVEYYSNYGFSKSKGDCNTQAATFTAMAQVLGYDAVFVRGCVPQALKNGKPANFGAHAWTTIKIDKKKYVFDPNFERTNKAGWKFKYGAKKHYRYFSKKKKELK